MSEPLALSRTDLIKVAIEGTIYALGGAVLVSIGLFLQTGTFDWKLFLGALGSILINLGHKFFADTTV